MVRKKAPARRVGRAGKGEASASPRTSRATGTRRSVDYAALAAKMGSIDGATIQLSSDTLICEPAGYIPTRSTLLDLLLGSRGVPVGSILNVVGCEGVGKSTCIVSILAQAQTGMIAPPRSAPSSDYMQRRFALAYGDCEMRHAKERAEEIGLVSSEDGSSQYLYVAFSHLESMFESIHQFIDMAATQSEPDDPVWPLYAVDTMDLNTEAKCKGKGEGVGGRAAVMWEQFRMLSYPLALHNATLLLSSPLQEVIDFGNKYEMKYRKATWTTSGGAAPRYRGANLLLREGALFYTGAHRSAPEGYWMKAKLAKSHYAKPNREVLIPVSYATGYDEPRSLVAYLLGHDRERKVPRESVKFPSGERFTPVRSSGAWFELADGNVRIRAQGEERFVDAVREGGDELVATLSWYVRAAWGLENNEQVWLPGATSAFWTEAVHNGKKSGEAEE